MKRYVEGYKEFRDRLSKIAKRLPPPLATAVIPTKRSFLRSHAEWEHSQETGIVLPGALRIAHEEYRGKRGSYITEVGSGDCLINPDWRIWTVQKAAEFLFKSESWIYENLKGIADKWNGWDFYSPDMLTPYKDDSVRDYWVTYQCSYQKQCKEEARRRNIKLDCTQCPGLINLPPYTG